MEPATRRWLFIAMLIAAVGLAACVVRPRPAHNHHRHGVHKHEKQGKHKKHKPKKHKKHRDHRR
jgi:hypothetical protein